MTPLKSSQQTKETARTKQFGELEGLNPVFLMCKSDGKISTIKPCQTG